MSSEPSTLKRLGLDVSLAADGQAGFAANALCPICHDFLEEVVEVNCAGRHVFCRPCISETERMRNRSYGCYRGKSCPSCRGTYSQIIAAGPLTRSFIDQVKWKCVHVEKGCAFTGTKKQMEVHLETECAEQERECPFEGCTVKIRRSLLLAHQAICPFRLVPCPHCNESVPFNGTKTHLEECRLFPVDCPNHCGQKLPRGDVSAHRQTDCPEQKVLCQVDGCTERVRRCELSEHMESCPFRLLPCAHCDKCIPANAMEKHLKQVCNKVPVECPNGCGESPAKENVGVHMETECKEAEVECGVPGCGEKRKRGEMAGHEEGPEGMSKHVRLLVSSLSAAKQENAQTKKRMEELSWQMNYKMEELDWENSKAQKKLAELKRENAQSKNRLANLEGENGELKREAAEAKQSVEELQSSVEQLQEDVAALKRGDLELTVRLPDFKRMAQRMRKNQVLWSSPFYFQENLFNLIVYPKGAQHSPHNYSAVYLQSRDQHRRTLHCGVEMLNHYGESSSGKVEGTTHSSQMGFGCQNFCTVSDLFAAVCEDGTLEFSVSLSAQGGVVSGYAGAG
uniref:TRAF-type domain-containing protein n=1 Tax=Chromera velia CCMP2878 TaxID=1169474 RepID=A0A0G4HXS7_9ALVE|eukprot:Cvel_9330.t1-p1 / transcript=Cvel_9330.t1 / gene=Cvel_9330 / organism=Chromera_velia_CCMP2878 / gene_product=TNF receptor-associated factor 4, putative / transcript_product=TNF receptor-associated factor 4, putative / location=Cvel_scaffold535:36998-39650(-) / protein_length=566 / sequence_SO=supercontig / SO=protein_coding / is_pseudo=false